MLRIDFYVLSFRSFAQNIQLRRTIEMSGLTDCPWEFKRCPNCWNIFLQFLWNVLIQGVSVKGRARTLWAPNLSKMRTCLYVAPLTWPSASISDDASLRKQDEGSHECILNSHTWGALSAENGGLPPRLYDRLQQRRQTADVCVGAFRRPTRPVHVPYLAAFLLY